MAGIAEVTVFGEKFSIVSQGNFSSNTNIQWTILFAKANQYIVIVPLQYGEQKARDLLDKKYYFNYAIDPMTKSFVISVRNLPLAVVSSELSKL